MSYGIIKGWLTVPLEAIYQATRPMSADNRCAKILVRRPLPGHASGLNWRTLARGISCLLLMAVLAACAGSVAPPTAVLDLPPNQKATLQLGDITADAGPGVAMTPDDLNRIVQLVTAEIHASSPAVLARPGAAQATLMKITITRYDKGSSFARFMLAGLGQIYIEGNVELLDSQGKCA